MRSSNEQSSKVLCILADRDQDSLQQCKQALAGSGMAELCAETTSYALAVSHVERSKPDFVFCSVDGDPDEAFSLIGKTREKFPSVRIVCVGGSTDSNLILQCFRKGADEYLPKPLQKEALIEMFPRLQVRRNNISSSPQTAPNKGKTIAVWGSRGGCGATTVACNLAHLLSQSHTTCLVDLHEMQGDLGLFFDQQPAYSIQDIWGRRDRIDDALVDSITVEIEGGLRLLLQSAEESPESWNGHDFDRLMTVLQSKNEYTVLDIGHDTEIAQQAVPHIDVLYLIVNQTLPSLYLASRKVRWLENFGFDLSQVRIVINAYNKSSSVTQKHITKTLMNSNVTFVRNDESSVHSAMNQGIPLQEVSRWGKAYKDLARIAKQLETDAAGQSVQKESAQEIVLKPLLSSNTAIEAIQ